MHHNGIIHLIIGIMGQHNIGAHFKRSPVGKTFQGFTSHHHNLSRGGFPEKFLVHGDAHQKMIVFTDGPVIVYCCDQIHMFVSPSFEDQSLHNLLSANGPTI